MGLNFVAIDFEIAAPQWSTPCSVAMVRVRDGQVCDSWSSLINPESEFGAMQIRIHGITPTMVAGAPKFPEVLPQIIDFIGPDVMIAHNVPFDGGVLRQTIERYNLHIPEIRTFCTYAAARLLKLGCINYRLPSVCGSLGVTLGKHHDAVCDARACAECMIAIAEKVEADDMDQLAKKLYVSFGSITDFSAYSPCMGDGDGIYSGKSSARSYTAILADIKAAVHDNIAEEITAAMAADGSTFVFRCGDSVLFHYKRGAMDFIRCRPFPEQAEITPHLSIYKNGDVRLPLNDSFNVSAFACAMARRAEDIFWDSGLDGFGCCSYFNDCSDAGACIFASDPRYRRCHYRRHLEAGRIFYGKNRNYFPEDVTPK